MTFRNSADFDFFVDGFLALLVVWLPAAVGWWTVGWLKGRQTEILLSAGALSCQAAGDTYYVLQSAAGEDVPLPSPHGHRLSGFLCPDAGGLGRHCP
ncbi:hypothetical protein ACOM2C_10460 [Pseudarthrobacter sp. So.54]